MPEPKTLEDLDKILENQKQNRIKEYNKRKWLFVLFPRLTWGISTFPDLINKDKKFWIVYLILITFVPLVLIILRFVIF